jgi:RNA recognition motif-containing protein
VLALVFGLDCLRKMSGRDENQLFIGRLPRGSRASELEDVFYKYGKMTRCDVKQGIKMGKCALPL